MIAKPLKVNIDNVDLDTLELFEAVQEEVANTGKVKASAFKALIAAMFEDWTVAEAGKITRAEMPQVLAAIGEAFNSIPLDAESE